MSTHKKTKVLVAMSGGVDSSVVAALLVKQGYSVTGAFMKQWSETKELNGQCSWKKDRRDALRVAAHLGIPLLTLDFEKEYNDWVMSYLFAEYEAGRTPNPDVLCNKFIKFGAWLDRARALGFDFLATGHYALLKSTRQKNVSVYHLMQAKDDTKDQTYFLHQLNQAQLAHTLFPIGKFHKTKVRRLARRWHLPTADRPESMGICFIGETPMKEFLQQKITKKPGAIVNTAGDTVGTHEGLAFYTIGQRHGLTQAGGSEPWYVVAKRQETNQLVVGHEDDPALYTKEIQLPDMHWISGQAPTFPLSCKVRLRHRQPLSAASVTNSKEGVRVVFQTPQKAVTPGQFAVLYKKKECLGGGTIT